MMTGSRGRLMVRLAGAAALLGLTVACAGPQHGVTTAPAGYGKDDVSRAERLVQYCDRLTAKGELVTALGLCARAHEIDPDNPETLMRVAQILQKLDRTQAAAQTFGLLLERHPGHHEARYSLGKLYMESGDPSLAALHFDQAIRTNPEDPRPYNALGILRDQAGEHAAAQALYHSALERDPRNLSVRNNLGLSLALSGQREEAIEVLAALAVGQEANQTVLRNLEAAYAAGNAHDPMGGAATAMEAPLPKPGEAGPAEAEMLLPGTAPQRPLATPRSAPMNKAPTVEAVPATPPADKPTPLYPPKPSAAREPEPVIRPKAGKPAVQEQEARAEGSIILAAAAQLMTPPAWADFEPGDLVNAAPSAAPAEPVGAVRDVRVQAISVPTIETIEVETIKVETIEVETIEVEAAEVEAAEAGPADVEPVEVESVEAASVEAEAEAVEVEVEAEVETEAAEAETIEVDAKTKPKADTRKQKRLFDDSIFSNI